MLFRSSLPQALTTLLDPATCGPVCLALPQDVQAESFDFPEEFFAENIHEIPRPRPDLNELKRAAELISQAKKPVIIAGGGVHYSRAEEELAHYAKSFAIPVVETMSGKTSLPWSNPLLVGPLGVTGSDPVNALVNESDLIIAVGTRLQDFTTGSWTLFGNKTIVAINVARFDAIKRHSVAVVGDAKVTLEELSEHLKPAGDTRDQWLSRAATLKQECESLQIGRAHV